MYHVRATRSNGVGARLDATRFKLLIENGKIEWRDRQPKLWILASRHSGDNTQLMAIAGALGWPTEIKRLFYRWHEELVRIAGLASLSAVDASRSSPIGPPWPDVILSAGRSTEAVARWIKRHGNPAAKIVFVGTPWASPECFDLVITTPQYGLPQAHNILHLPLPVHSVTPERLAEEGQRWAGRLTHLPERRIAVLVGGASGPYTFSRDAAIRLASAANRMANERNAALLVTTSARTPATAASALENAITAPACIFHYAPDAPDNPFFAFLDLADEVIVTADSISMLAEASATGKPVWLFDIEDGQQSMRAEEGHDPLPPIGWRGKSLETTAFRALMRLTPPRWSRDLRVVHRGATKQRLAQWLGEEPLSRATPAQQNLEAAAARIRGLFGL